MEDAASVELDGFSQFVVSRGRDLWRSAWLLTGDAHHAEDLVQTALAKTHARYDGSVNDRQFEALVRTTMYRTFVSWWRRLQWRSEMPTATIPEGVVPASGDPAIREDLRRALDLLPRVQRTVLLMRFFDDMSTASVAAALGMPKGTITSHVHRGLASLRKSSHLVDLEELT